MTPLNLIKIPAQIPASIKKPSRYEQSQIPATSQELQGVVPGIQARFKQCEQPPRITKPFLGPAMKTKHLAWLAEHYRVWLALFWQGISRVEARLNGRSYVSKQTKPCRAQERKQRDRVGNG